MRKEIGSRESECGEEVGKGILPDDASVDDDVMWGCGNCFSDPISCVIRK